MKIGNAPIQRDFATAFESGLRMKYGEAWGALYGEVVRYKAHSPLVIEDLRTQVDTEAVPVLSAILAGKITPSTLHAIRSLMIGAAVLGETAAVVRWATEGLNRSKQFGGDWLQTEPQWQAVLADPSQFIQYARQIKYFLMAI